MIVTFVLATATLMSLTLSAEETPSPQPVSREHLTDAVSRGLKVVERAARNYPEHRECFACHHQTVPLAAMREARRIGLKVDETLFGDTQTFVRRYFSDRVDALEEGKGIPGRAFMVGYGAWAFELADVEMPHDLRRAMAQYVIRRQESDGRWTPAAIRPPAEQSEVTNTALALRVLRPKGRAVPFDLDPEWSVTAEAAERHARQWLDTAPAKLQEDLVFRLWSLSWFGDELHQHDGVVRRIIERQQADGGWAAEVGLGSEAYSTGLTLFALLDTGASPGLPPIERGIKYLARTQQADGSWLVATRAKPVQVFFDNGDPHGKNQFISISATGWSVAALARFISDTQPETKP